MAAPESDGRRSRGAARWIVGIGKPERPEEAAQGPGGGGGAHRSKDAVGEPFLYEREGDAPVDVYIPSPDMLNIPFADRGAIFL